ncbi:S-layer homology domain-containing protein [Peptococcus simiae]|uniref:S-layer homology domain-containing protein n=1 Tax=Peptococcus simiae TaxID=1643805 RepID=UPI003981798F
MSNKIKRVAASVLIASFGLTSILPSAAMAANDKEDPEKTIKVVESYVNGVSGKQLAEPDTYKEKPDAEYKAKDIDGYEFKTYEQDVTNLYLNKNLTYLVGYPDKTVRPFRYMTRAEATAIFYRLYDGHFPKATREWQPGMFSDVSEDAWYIKPLKQMYESGIAGGEDGKFRPNDPITRAELTALANRFNPKQFNDSNDKVTNKSFSFSDVYKDKWYANDIALAAANKWVSGYPDGSFKPENHITRAETVSVINRVTGRQLTEEQADKYYADNPYTDLNKSDWFFADMLEATVDHSPNPRDWKGKEYSSDDVNVVVEKYVDEDGNAIAEDVRSEDKVGRGHKDFTGVKYIGQARVVKYIYEGVVYSGSSSKVDKETNKKSRKVTEFEQVKNDPEGNAKLEFKVPSPYKAGSKYTLGYVDGDNFTPVAGSIVLDGDMQPGEEEPLLREFTIPKAKLQDGKKLVIRSQERQAAKYLAFADSDLVSLDTVAPNAKAIEVKAEAEDSKWRFWVNLKLADFTEENGTILVKYADSNGEQVREFNPKLEKELFIEGLEREGFENFRITLEDKFGNSRVIKPEYKATKVIVVEADRPVRNMKFASVKAPLGAIVKVKVHDNQGRLVAKGRQENTTDDFENIKLYKVDSAGEMTSERYSAQPGHRFDYKAVMKDDPTAYSNPMSFTVNEAHE